MDSQISESQISIAENDITSPSPSRKLDSKRTQDEDDSQLINNAPNLSESEIEKLETWIVNEKFGDFIQGTKIIACKTFLNEPKWLKALQPYQRFKLSHLVQYLDQDKGVTLSLIIDINRSYDYYNFPELQKTDSLLQNTKHIKYCLQNAAVPSEQHIEEIYELLKKSHENGEVVAIHCFHGINRTGYLVCFFLCRYFEMSAEKAIEIFEEARKHKIDHEELTADLKRRFPSKTDSQ